MKRILAAALCLMMVLSLAACGGSKNTQQTTSTPATTQPQTSEPAQTAEPETPAWKPTSTVNVIVGFAAGGGMDSLARAVAQYIDLDGQTMYVTNVEGSGGKEFLV